MFVKWSSINKGIIGLRRLKAVCRFRWTSLIRLVQGDPGGLWSQSLTGASGRGRIRQTLILSELFLVGSDNVRTF